MGKRERNKDVATLLFYLSVRGLPKLRQRSITCSIAREVPRKPPAREKGQITADMHDTSVVQLTIYNMGV